MMGARAKLPPGPDQCTAATRANRATGLGQSEVDAALGRELGKWAMVHVQSARRRDHPVNELLDRRDAKEYQLEMSALREENAELRKLVIHLSKLVIRNALEN